MSTLRIRLSLIVILLLPLYLQAQINSPFSRFGIGLISPTEFSSQQAMGSISLGVANNRYINTTNPASYTSFYKSSILSFYNRSDSTILDSLNQLKLRDEALLLADSTIDRTLKSTTLEIGVSSRFSNLRLFDESSKSADGTLDYIAFGFPIPNFGGISMGLMPYSRVGYNVQEEIDGGDTMGTVIHRYIGDGGLLQFYAGAAARIKRLSIGFNSRIIFGGIYDTSITILVDQPNSLDTRRSISNKMSGILWELGLQYEQPISYGVQLRLGAMGHLRSTLKTTVDTVWDRVLVDNDNIIFIDTLRSTPGAKSTLELPISYGIGFAFEKEGKWLVGMDYRVDRWGDLNESSNQKLLSNSWRLSVGGEIIPDSKGKFLERTNYRLGAYYTKSNLVVNEQVVDYGMTFGFGIPIVKPKERLFSTVDFAVQIGKRGSIQQNVLSENYFKITLGFNLNDSNWLRKSKYY